MGFFFKKKSYFCAIYILFKNLQNKVLILILPHHKTHLCKIYLSADNLFNIFHLTAVLRVRCKQKTDGWGLHSIFQTDLLYLLLLCITYSLFIVALFCSEIEWIYNKIKIILAMSPRWMESSRSSMFAKLVQVPNYKNEFFLKILITGYISLL